MSDAAVVCAIASYHCRADVADSCKLYWPTLAEQSAWKVPVRRPCASRGGQSGASGLDDGDVNVRKVMRIKHSNGDQFGHLSINWEAGGQLIKST